MLVTGRKLPIGIQTFEDIRNDGYLYVDKTALMWTIANIGKPFFLSRPRRFGKGLLISTFEVYFKGRRELFTGLAVEELEKKWEEHPVLHLDLNARKYTTPADLDAILNQHLERWEAVYGEEKRDRASEERFAYVIRRASEQTGKGVVVLVDEYDKPLLQAIQNEPLLESYRSTLKAFYGVLKSADRYLRFAFLTGVTKFSQVSVFSDLNQLNSQTERHYQVIIYLIFKLMGQFTQAEVHSSRGRADAVVKTPKFVYVFEFKLKGTAGQALQQIEEKGYTLPYAAEGRQVIKVGVEFSAEKRNVERWMVEEEK
ncbi:MULTISPECIES: AAA family ATPase [Bacteroides]|jgi:hypothetical protein|uniref:ATP-binding protein n=1 Tax=Bacteroides TaxID=816 RepID=UPI00164C7B28|nr:MULTISPECIES: AAA family ATPase [Bacteroides]MBC5588423.1 ATP-binding protein [Bacteroides sp. NSJ-39]